MASSYVMKVHVFKHTTAQVRIPSGLHSKRILTALYYIRRDRRENRKKPPSTDFATEPIGAGVIDTAVIGTDATCIRVQA